jgi:hypothetical protein
MSDCGAYNLENGCTSSTLYAILPIYYFASVLLALLAIYYSNYD